MSTGRTDAFTDGVFAIAITLLVLEIHLPEFPSAPDNAAMLHALEGLGESLGTYLLSFATIGIIWMNHNVTHRTWKHADRLGNAFNLLLLAVVCFIPYPTALVSKYGPLEASTALYGATFALMSIAYVLDWAYGTHLQHRYDATMPDLSLRDALPGLIGVVGYIVGTALAFVSPTLAVCIYVAITIYYAVPGVFTRKRDALRAETDTP